MQRVESVKIIYDQTLAGILKRHEEDGMYGVSERNSEAYTEVCCAIERAAQFKKVKWTAKVA
jgi:hypothetical protein